MKMRLNTNQYTYRPTLPHKTQQIKAIKCFFTMSSHEIKGWKNKMKTIVLLGDTVQ